MGVLTVLFNINANLVRLGVVVGVFFYAVAGRVCLRK